MGIAKLLGGLLEQEFTIKYSTYFKLVTELPLGNFDFSYQWRNKAKNKKVSVTYRFSLSTRFNRLISVNAQCMIHEKCISHDNHMIK